MVLGGWAFPMSEVPLKGDDAYRLAQVAGVRNGPKGHGPPAGWGRRGILWVQSFGFMVKGVG